VVYLDTSAAMAQLLAEDRVPRAALWQESLVSSRLLEYEMWNRIHARGLTRSHADGARDIVARLALVELTPMVLSRALEPFPAPVRTLDALHLASMDYLRQNGQKIAVASYDARLVLVAERMGFEIYEI